MSDAQTIAKQKAILRDTLLTPTFMMCAPTYFDPSFEAHGGDVENSFMGENVDPELAQEQWHDFKSTIEKIGGRVILVPAKEGLLDQVYTADPAAFHTDVIFTPDGEDIERIHFKAMHSKFTNADRQGELTSHFNTSCEHTRALRTAAHGTNITIGQSFQKAQFNTEGSGDNVYDRYRGLWWSGYVQNPSDPKSGRSDIRAHAELATLTNRGVMSLEVCGDGYNDYFHIDTSQTPLPRGHVLSYDGGITEGSHDLMRRTALVDFGLPEDDYLIKVSKADAELMACNLTPVTEKDLIVNSLLSDTLVNSLERAGYNTHPVDYSEFLKGGGFFHCTANHINIMGPKGGIANDPDFYDRIDMALS